MDTDMGGSCSCDYDGEGPTIYDVKLVKARKEHTCCECHETIQKGEVYERVKGLWEGSWGLFKTCKPCSTMRKDLCSCAPLETLRETIMYEFGVDYLDETWEIPPLK